MNITVRSGGIINNTMTEAAFTVIAEKLFGHDKTVDEYIELFNADPQAIRDCTVVHREVLDEVVDEVDEDPLNIYLDAATKNLGDAVGHDVKIEFADEE